MAGLSMDIKLETRLCEVNGEFGYFHCWEHWSNVIDASPLRGGHPGGQPMGRMESQSLHRKILPLYFYAVICTKLGAATIQF